MSKEFEGKKLLILGGNPETIPLVDIANNWGIKTIVASARHMHGKRMILKDSM